MCIYNTVTADPNFNHCNTQKLINHKIVVKGKLIIWLLHDSTHCNMPAHTCLSEDKKCFGIQISEWIFFFFLYIQSSEKAKWRLHDVLSGFKILHQESLKDLVICKKRKYCLLWDGKMSEITLKYEQIEFWFIWTVF